MTHLPPRTGMPLHRPDEEDAAKPWKALYCGQHGAYSLDSPGGCPHCRIAREEREARAETRRIFAEAEAGGRMAKYRRIGSAGGVASAKAYEARRRVDRSAWPTRCGCGAAIEQNLKRQRRFFCAECRRERKRAQNRAYERRMRGGKA